MKLIKILVLLLLIQSAAFSQNKKKEILDCTKCHDCAIPTKDNPCLKVCPRDLMNTVYHMPLSIPKVLIIDNFKSEPNHYPPVKFSHQRHAEMSAISGSCQMCHHYNPAGAIIGCKECHEIKRKRTDLSKIDLNGAYHVQCINCHRTWSKTIECKTCHNQPNVKAKSDNNVHPKIEKPVIQTYETSYNKGKLVTFYHDEHTKTFGLDCVKCHNNDGCAKCHKKTETPLPKKLTTEEKHKKCSKCHSVKENCGVCHSDQKKGSFSHLATTGWQLNQFHSKIACQKCHTVKGQFSKLNRECTTCHPKWDSTNFKHSITGLTLDETHSANECETCHVEKNFTKPVCTNCHEANYKYPDKKPGKLLKKK